MKSSAARRGNALLPAMMVIAALAAVTTVGLAERDRNLSFEARSLRRHQARWAAESALARARARRAAGRPLLVSGRLSPHLVCDEIGYAAHALPDGKLRAEGWCLRAGRNDLRVAIEVRLKGSGRGRVTEWRESPGRRD